MSVDQLSALAGVLVSLAFGYVPGLAGWFADLESIHKRLVIALALFVVAISAMALSCWGIVDTITCDQPGLLGLINALIMALVANQATYGIAVKRAGAGDER